MAEKTALQQKLESEIMAAPWALLAPHHVRGAVFVVDPALPLVMVAMAVGQDRVDDVKGWLAAGQLAKVTAGQAAAWDESDQPFQVLIVQPYVLVTPIASK